MTTIIRKNANVSIEIFVKRHRANKTAKLFSKRILKASGKSEDQVIKVLRDNKIVSIHFGSSKKARVIHRISRNERSAIALISVSNTDDPGTNSTGPRGPRK